MVWFCAFNLFIGSILTGLMFGFGWRMPEGTAAAILSVVAIVFFTLIVTVAFLAAIAPHARKALAEMKANAEAMRTSIDVVEESIKKVVDDIDEKKKTLWWDWPEEHKASILAGWNAAEKNLEDTTQEQFDDDPWFAVGFLRAKSVRLAEMSDAIEREARRAKVDVLV